MAADAATDDDDDDVIDILIESVAQELYRVYSLNGKCFLE